MSVERGNPCARDVPGAGGAPDRRRERFLPYPEAAPPSEPEEHMKLPIISKSILVAGAVVAVASVAACSGANAFPLGVVSTEQGAGISVASIQVIPTDVTIDSIGQTYQLSGTALDDSGNPIPDAVINWSSSDLTIVTVSGNGLLTAQGNGIATVLASSGAVEAQVNVTVGATQP
jgi:hypothetical protein